MKSKANETARRLVSFLLVMFITLSMISIGIPAAVLDLSNLAADTEVSHVGADPLTVTIDTGASVTLYDNDANDYYDIGTADDLYAFASLVDDEGLNINAELTADIVVNEGKITEASDAYRTWDPVGKSHYEGTFDGNSHFVSGLYHVDTTSSYKGLFRVIAASGVVRNVTVKNSYIQGDDSTGGVVGYAKGTVENCHSIDNTIKGSDTEGKFIGGVVGYNDAATVTGCTNNSTVMGDVYVGGIVGYNAASSSVTDCHNSGSVTGDTQDVGGVVGYVVDSTSTVTDCTNSGTVTGVLNTGGIVGNNLGSVTGCVNSGNVTATANYTGGVVGLNKRYITDCSNSGDISGLGYVAGVAGYNNTANGDILRCYNIGNISGTANYVGGIAGSNYNATTIISCYNTGDVTSTGNYVGGVSGNNANTSATISTCYSTGTVTAGGTNVGGVVGANGTTITYCYYLDTSASGGIGATDTAGKAEAKTSEQFASGEVAYLLQSTLTEEVWGQTIGTDEIPQLFGDKVYEKGANCIDDPIKVYSNSPDVADHTVVNGFCKFCDYIEPAVDSDGDGYYEIGNAGNLYWFANQVDAGNTDYNAILTADITVNEGTITADSTDVRVWNPIGTTTSVIYKGTFNGNGKTISGLYYSGTGTYIGLIANTTAAAVVTDVHLENSYFAGGNYTAGIVGYNLGTITDCSNGATVVGSGNYTAGIAGYSKAATISGCSNSGTVTATGAESQYVGGIAGYSNNDILECYNTGDISSLSYRYVGGIVGYNTASTALVNNCYNTGAIYANTYSGGIVGYNYNASKITNCYNTGAVTVGSGSYIGAITGRCYSNSPTYTNCYYLEGSAAVACGNSVSSATATAVTSEQLASGGVVYLLQGSQETEVWGQTLEEDLIPQLHDDKVYLKGLGCVDDPVQIYSNDPYIPDHNYVNGFCTVCDGYEPAVDSDEDGYYEIDNAGKLYWFASQVNSGNNEINAVLTKDIFVNEGTITADSTGARELLPIGNNTTRFMGTFDGANHTVSGLYHSSAVAYVGLVGVVGADGVVTRVNVANSYISGTQYIGAVAGYTYGTVSNCSNSGTVVATTNSVGGVTGYINTGHVFECFNTGSVTGPDYVGGVVGYINNDGSLMENCYNTGDVTGTTYVGGVCGRLNNAGEFKNCYNTGDVTGTSYTGGVLGRNQNSGVYTNNYYLEGTATGGYSGSDTAGKAEVRTAEAFASGEVAYLLQGSQETEVWGQTLGEDLIPQFYDDKVYKKGVQCAGDPVQVYSNDPSTPDHNYINGFCTVCDGYEPALDTDGDWYYEIDNAGKLYWFAAQVNSGNTEISAKLTKDIVINQGDITAESTDARQWTAIGNDDTPFKGHFNGNNKTISGMYHNSTDTNVGLIGNLNAGAYISDVHITNSYIKAKSNSAFIAGDNYATISGCSVTNSAITGTGNYIGGIAGYSSTAGCIVECFNESTVAGGAYAGGIAGDNHGGAGIYNCYNTGDVSSSGGYCGGITGYNTGSGSNVMNCYTIGAVTGSTSYDGAVVGRNNEGTITNCYFLTGAHAGGINGSNTAGKAEVKTAEQFASGEVAYLLQGTQEGNIWGQTLGEDALPALHDDTVYLKGEGCPDDPNQIYSNTPDTPAHNYVNGFCTVCDGYEPALDTDGDGYYEIDNGGKLYWYASQVNAESETVVNAILTTDIFVNEGTITADSTDARAILPIGTSSIPFAGDFNGNGKKISGLYYKGSTSTTYVGLFASIAKGGIVHDLTVDNSYVNGGSYVGGIAGHNLGTVTRCINYATVVNTTTRSAGIVGFNQTTGVVCECINYGTISGVVQAGGIVGINHSADATVTNCYNFGSVSTTGNYCGGIVAYSYTDSILTNCYNAGTVNGGGSYEGAITGRNNGAELISNCYYLTGSHAGGINSAASSGKAEVRTAEQFASGEVAYLLQGEQETEIWGQTIGEDAYPLFYDDKVYYSDVNCADDAPIGYTNYATKPDHTFVSTVTPPTNTEYGYTTHVCSVCSKTYVDSYVRPINVSGDFFLFEETIHTEPYLELFAESVKCDEPIYCKVYNGSWIGVYPASVTEPANKEDAIYTINIEDLSGNIFDLRTCTYNASNTNAVPACLMAGESYNVFLFSDENYTVAVSKSFTVVSDNRVDVDENTYLQTNRKVYAFAESIMVNAQATANTYAWVGVYPKDADIVTTPAEHIVYIGSKFSTNYGGVNTDLISSSVVNPNINLLPGDYDVYLFGNRTRDVILAQVTITVNYGYINTDKTEYGYGESIYAHAEAYDIDKLDISNTLVTTTGVNFRDDNNTDATLHYKVSEGDTVTLIAPPKDDMLNWAYVEHEGTTGYLSPYLDLAEGSDVKIYGYLAVDGRHLYASADTSSTKTISSIPAGTAFNYLSTYSKSYIKVQIGGYTGYLYRNDGVTDTSKFSIIFEPFDTEALTPSDSTARVDLYSGDVTPSADTANEGSYNLSDNSGVVLLQNVATVDTPITSGDKKLYLFGTEGYDSVLDTAAFTVSDKITGTFSRGSYYVENLSDGFANGKVILELSEESYGYIGSGSYASVYWADADGNPLEDFRSFVEIPLENNLMTFSMQPYSIIPEGATGLVAYVSYNGTDSDAGFYIPLPEGCKTYDGLDSATYDEFQVVSDTKVGNTTNTYYDDHYVSALTDIANQSGANSLGIFITGDSTNDGTAEQFASLNTYREQVSSSANTTLPPVYVAHGNTDDRNGLGQYVDFVSEYTEGVTEEKLYYSMMIGGYKFIFLAVDVSDEQISAAQIEWLEAELLDNEENNSGKPVFVLCHKALDGTNLPGTDVVSNISELSPVFSKYDDVFVMSGNTLAAITSTGNVFGGSATLPVNINVGAVARTRRFVDGVNQGYIADTSQGMYVRVYEDKVVLMGRDFITGKWIPESTCVLYNDDVRLPEKFPLIYGFTADADDFLTSEHGRPVTFTSSEENIATIDSTTGLVTTVNYGHTDITAFADATNTEVVTRAVMDLRVKKPYDPGDPSDTNLLGIDGDFETGVNMLHAEDPDFVSHTVTLYKGTYEFILKNIEYGFLQGKDITIVDKTDSKGFVIEEESDARFTLEASGGVYTFTFDEDTLILTIDADLFETGEESTFELMGLYNSLDEGITMIHDEDTDVVSATVELYTGEYSFNIRNNCTDIIGSDMVIKDSLTGQVMNKEEVCTLLASGGTYTFDYCLSKNELTISFVPANIEEFGSKIATIYVDFKDSDFTSTPYVYIWDETIDSVLNNIGPLKPGQILDGPNAEGYYYRTFKYDTSYQFVISDGESIKTADSIVYDQSEVYVYFTEGTEYETEKEPWFWIDLTPGDPSDPIDRLYPELVGTEGNYPLYCFYLPSGVDAKKLRLYGDEGADIKVSFVPVTVDGTRTVNVSGGVNKATKYNITDGKNKTFAKLTVKQSAEVPALYINSDSVMPIGTGYEAAHKEGYSTAGTLKLVDKTVNTVFNDVMFTELSIKAGDTPSTDILGKYSYNLTLKEAAALTAGGSTKYELVSYDADEARLRNMTAIELASALGLEGSVTCQPVDVYNNGVYMGAYLLIDRAETEDEIILEFTAGENGFTSVMGQPISCVSEGVIAELMAEIEEKWNEAEGVIYNPDATYAELGEVIDIESFAKVYILQELTKGINAGADSYYVYYRDGKFTAAFKPEYDNTLGQLNSDLVLDECSATDAEGWWARYMEIEGEGLVNAQAALCDNPVFWNAIKGEWIEVFYGAALAMVPTEATYNTGTKKVSGQSGTYAEYYTMMAKSAAMDDVKWGVYTDDALGANDTGDTYEQSFAYLNNFIYERVAMMNIELGYGYTLAEPTLSTKKDTYAVNEEIELKAEIGSSGTLTYEFYNSKDELLYTETTNNGYVVYTTSYSEEVEETIKVVISSERADSPVEATTSFKVEYFDFILTVDAPEKVVGGTLIELKASTNVEEDVEYVLTDIEGNYLNASEEGLFEIVTSTDDEAGLLEFVVKATTTVDGITYTTSKNIVVDLIHFDFSVTLTAPERVEAGLDISLIAKAEVNDDVAIKYTFYNAEDMTLLGTNYSGACIFSTDGLEGGALVQFMVTAECEAYGNTYTARSEVITVEVESVTEKYNVTVYFKSTSTYGYKPLITTEGAVEDMENAEMQKDTFICKNETETASYFWYKAEFTVSKKSPSAYIRIVSARYAMEVQTNLLINEDTTYYFATDNLNDGTELVDLTHASEDERNWCESAVHMVYDAKADGAEKLAQVSARVDLRLVGDTTADGKVNIRDATYIQKGLADIITMSKTDLEVADVDDDQKVSVKDATCIQKKLAGIIKNSYDIGGSQYETN